MVKPSIKLIPGALAFILVAAAGLQAAPVVGSNDGGNCYPFSCGPSDGVTRYQQVYSASAFGSGSLLIQSISFFLSEAGPMDTATYSLSFSTTSADVNTLSSDLDSNVGIDAAFFTSSIVGGAMPNVLTFTGIPFLYNPLSGNLLLDVVITNASPLGDYNSFFQADYTQIQTARIWNGESAADNGALVTEFNEGAVPEPGTYGLLGLSSAALIAFRKWQTNRS